jgi:hypothetical protein
MSESNSNTADSARALDRVLIRARHLAQCNNTQQLAGVLDWTELLADDIAASDDRSRQFSEHLQGLGDDHPDFAGVFRDYHEGRM